jgi:hypothetical protein
VPLEEEKYRKKYSREIKWRNKTVFTYTIFFQKSITPVQNLNLTFFTNLMEMNFSLVELEWRRIV